MLSWLKKYSKTLNFFGGILILLITVVLYFWNTGSGQLVTSKAQTGTEKRFERSHQSSNIIKRQAKKHKDMSIFSKKLKSNKQTKNFLLFLMVLGFGMLGFSLYSKYKEKKIS